MINILREIKKRLHILYLSVIILIVVLKFLQDLRKLLLYYVIVPELCEYIIHEFN